MQIPLKINFIDIPTSDALEQAIRNEAEQLEHYCNRVIGCRVNVSKPAYEHRHKGSLYSVSIDLTVAGEEIIVNREHHLSHAHEDPYVAVRQAFHSARRELQDYLKRSRHEIKAHGDPPHGRVTRIFPAEGCGFITDAEGREVYFHQNSVLEGAFERLKVGDEVRYVEEPAEKGPNATSVKLLHSHRHSAKETQGDEDLNPDR